MRCPEERCKGGPGDENGVMTVKIVKTDRKKCLAICRVCLSRPSAPALTDLEAEIDRLIFKMMEIGDLTEIEDWLRRARRLLYGALTRG